MRHRHLSQRLAAGALLLATAAPAQAPHCKPAGTAFERRVEEIVSTVNEGRPGTLSQLVADVWLSPTAGGPPSAAVLADLGLWHWRSRRITLLAACAGTDSASAYALLGNELSEETDSLMMTIDPATGRLRQYRIRYGVRVPSVAAASDDAMIREVRRITRRLVDAGVFAGEVLIAKEGVPIFNEAFGIGNLERRTPVRLGERYSNASMGKLFTATAVMQLVQQGRLRLEDSLGMLVPSMKKPRGIGSVTVAQLLSHTSGIVPGADTLAFKPGTRFEYSNYGFNVLADSIVAPLVGRPFAEHYADAIFKPAGMTQTISLMTKEPRPALLPNYAVNFDTTGFTSEPNALMQNLPAMGSGHFFTTGTDLLRFAEAFRKEGFLAPGVVETMRTEKFPGSGYGYGVMLWRGPGVWGHGGDLPGTDADLEIYGTSGYVAVVLSNRSGVNDPIRRRIAALLAGRPGALK
ncbi:MAG: beta-lactamase family protein [Gemmatimonadales bacterium]|nr:beta-lactamase family protein [Gemmatimonadales bacterium]